MQRDLAIVGVLWAVLTVAGELLAVFVDFYPVALFAAIASDQLLLG